MPDTQPAVVAQPLFFATNHHPESCGSPPHVTDAVDPPDSYRARRTYFEGRHGDQWIFEAQIPSRKQLKEDSELPPITLRGGDIEWDNVLTVKQLELNDVLEVYAGLSEAQQKATAMYFSMTFAALPVRLLRASDLLTVLTLKHRQKPAVIKQFGKLVVPVDANGKFVLLNASEAVWLQACVATLPYEPPQLSKDDLQKMLADAAGRHAVDDNQDEEAAKDKPEKLPAERDPDIGILVSPPTDTTCMKCNGPAKSHTLIGGGETVVCEACAKRDAVVVYNQMKLQYPDADMLPFEQYTCHNCQAAPGCEYVFDLYNTGGDCLALK